MTEFKLVIGAKDGKSYQKEVKSPEADNLLKIRIGQKISGDQLGFSGYEFEITGGSDKCGFPMRLDLQGASRRKILSVKSKGMHIANKGIRKRKNGAMIQIFNPPVHHRIAT